MSASAYIMEDLQAALALLGISPEFPSPCPWSPSKQQAVAALRMCSHAPNACACFAPPTPSGNFDCLLECFSQLFAPLARIWGWLFFCLDLKLSSISLAPVNGSSATLRTTFEFAPFNHQRNCASQHWGPSSAACGPACEALAILFHPHHRPRLCHTAALCHGNR